MSGSLCETTKRYLASAGDEGQPPPPNLRLHLTDCESCARLAGRYRAGVTAFANLTAALPERLPDFRAIRDAARAPAPRDFWGWLRAPWLVPAVAFAIVAGLGIGWWLSTFQDASRGEPGRLTVVASSGPSAPLVSLAISEGQRLTVPAEATVVLEDPGAARLTLASASEVEVVSWRVHQVLRLGKGEVRAAVHKREVGQRFEVRTANAVVSVVGTEFVVRTGGDGATHVSVSEGVVRVSSPDGVILATLGAGESYVVPPAPRVVVASREEPEAKPEPLPQVPEATPAPLEAPAEPEPKPAPTVGEPAPPVVAPPRDAKPGKLEERPEPAPVAAPPEPTPVPDTPKPAPVEVEANPVVEGPPEQVAVLGPPAHTEPSPPDVVPEPAEPQDDEGADEPGVDVDDQPERSGLLRQAKKLLRGHREADAIELLTRGIRYGGTDHPRMLKLLGRAHDVVGKLERKAQTLRDAMATSSGPRRAAYAGKLARILDQRLNRSGESQKLWEEALTLDPDGRLAARAHWVLARGKLEAGRRSDAQRHLETILVRFPNAREAELAFDRLGKTLLDGGDYRAAAHHYEPSLGDSDPTRAELAFVGLIRARLGEGRGAEVKSLAAAYFRRFPDGARKGDVEALLRRVK
jgi:hypothetical protein